MYIERKIDNYLKEWKESKKFKPLLLRGIRQCGKTSAVRNLSKSFAHYVEINLEREPDLCKVFEGELNIQKIITYLEIHTSTNINDEDTLIFIDEIQNCPRAITALRYFYEDRPNLHVIAAGSLLEFVLDGANQKVDFPVGRIRSIFMFPFSFNEFLCGTNHIQLSSYLNSLDISNDSNLFHDKLIECYKTYLIVGGMPEAVSTYVETQSILECQQIHRDILDNFIDDFNKYDSKVSADIIRKVFDYAMHNVCNQTKSSSAIRDVSAYYFDECISLLNRAGLVYPVKASSCETIPLGACEKDANKKLIVFDTGVYLTACGLNVESILTADIFDDLNKGDVVEMATGLELIKAQTPYMKPQLHYWYKSGANAEIDYVIVKENKILPIEVKASNKGSMQSLHSFLNSHPDIPYGYRVSLENFSTYDKIKVYPVYAISKLLQSTK